MWNDNKNSTLKKGLRSFLIVIGSVCSMVCAYFVILSFLANDDILNYHTIIPKVAATTTTTTSTLDHSKQPTTSTSRKISWRSYRDDQLVAKYNKVSKWGSYRPGFYFGMKTSSPEDGNSMSSGIIWCDASRKQFRHDTKHDELTRFEWTRHDGKHYGKQILSDSSIGLELVTSFVTNHDQDSNLAWIQKVEMKTKKTITSKNVNDDRLPLFLYFGSDCADNVIRSTCLAKTEMKNLEVFDVHHGLKDGESGVQLIGRRESTWFVITAVATSADTLSYVSLPQVDIYGGTKKLIEEASGTRRNSRKKVNKDLNMFNEFGDFQNEFIQSNSANFLAFQAVYKESSEVYFIMQEFADTASVEEVRRLSLQTLHGDSWSNYWNELEIEYNQQFEKRFAEHMSVSYHSENSLVFSEDELESVKVALSSLLGGVGYFEGVPSIEFAVKSELDLKNFAQLQSESLYELDSARTKLFTGTPSRTAFPRGFLWDEGFHQMVMSHWDLDITFRVISDWLNAMYVSPLPDTQEDEELMGWIPREMILGEDSSRRVPDEFIIQRATIANPPTFLLVLESLLNRLSNVCVEDVNNETCSQEPLSERDKILEFLSDMYPRLHYWIQWFRYTQQGELPGSFRWRGRSSSDNKVIPNTLASGLDDYPRAIIPSFEERHLDLLCWMIKAYESMTRIEEAVVASGYQSSQTAKRIIATSSYAKQNRFLKSQLNALHWSNSAQGYFDYGLMNESALFVQEVLFRCSTKEQQSTTDIYVSIRLLQSGDSFCPDSHPRPLYPLGDGNGGYLMREKVIADSFSLGFIPRVGYVSIFPFLLKSISPSSPTLGSLLDMIEDPKLLFTPYGLRSIATTDAYYLRRNAPGDAPYWR